jgi:hypothetical protein
MGQAEFILWSVASLPSAGKQPLAGLPEERQAAGRRGTRGAYDRMGRAAKATETQRCLGELFVGPHR